VLYSGSDAAGTSSIGRTKGLASRTVRLSYGQSEYGDMSLATNNECRRYSSCGQTAKLVSCCLQVPLGVSYVSYLQVPVVCKE
jgi:hypothetical protein